MRKYDKNWKIATGQGDDYITGCSLDYPYFKKHFKLTAIDLSKHQALDADPKAMQQFNLQQGPTMLFIIQEWV